MLKNNLDFQKYFTQLQEIKSYLENEQILENLNILKNKLNKIKHMKIHIE